MHLPTPNPQFRHILEHPLEFVLGTLAAFRKNQGLLLAGAVAYYALLSIVPLLILIVIALSHLVDQAELLATLGRYLEWLLPSQSKAIIAELSDFLAYRAVIGSVLLVTMIFFSTLGFAVLDNAISVIFYHRLATHKRHFLVSASLPYLYILFLGLGLLVITLFATAIQAIGQESVEILGRTWSLGGVSGVLLYLLGLGGEILALSTLYYVMPAGRISLRHALIGGATASLLWEILRHLLVWYFSTLSQANVLYGSLATAIIVLLTLEIGATLLLLGAQVIAEYERLGKALEAPAEAIEVPGDE